MTRGHLDVLTRGVVQMIAADGKASRRRQTTNTCRSGRLSETPLANGRATVDVMRAVGLHEIRKRLEQPMPATVVMFSCRILRFSISLK